MSSQEQASAAVAKVSRKTVDELDSRIEAWLDTNVPQCAGARVTSLGSSDSNGLSGETYMVSLSGPNTVPSKVVLRKDVQDNTTNPQTNFANLVSAQTALGNIDTLSVPRVLGVETSSEVLGAPFLVMEFVEGDIPADVPSYAASGWVRDATVQQRERMWQSGIDFLVRLHALDWRQHNLDTLRFDIDGADELERCVNHAISMFRAEATGQSSPICERAIAWLLENRPTVEHESICWGDARIGNIIWRDFECKAAIDWEMSSLGTPGVDVGWWSFFHRWSTFGQGFPDLEGMSVGQALADLYEARGGSHIGNFVYYEVLAAVRGLSIWLRTYKAMSTAGALPTDMDPLGESIHMIKVLNTLMDEAESTSASHHGQTV